MQVQDAIITVAKRMVEAGQAESLPDRLRPQERLDGQTIYRPCCGLYSDASLDKNSVFADEYLQECSAMFGMFDDAAITRDTIKDFCMRLGDGDSQAGWALAQTIFHWVFNRKTDHIDEVPHKASAAAALRLAIGDGTTAQLLYGNALRRLLLLYGTTPKNQRKPAQFRFVREALAGLKEDVLKVDDVLLQQLNEGRTKRRRRLPAWMTEIPDEHAVDSVAAACKS
eukprot:SAG31_NODE_1557_length_7884_cov_69.027357_6_plen_226_part_00